MGEWRLHDNTGKALRITLEHPQTSCTFTRFAMVPLSVFCACMPTLTQSHLQSLLTSLKAMSCPADPLTCVCTQSRLTSSGIGYRCDVTQASFWAAQGYSSNGNTRGSLAEVRSQTSPLPSPRSPAPHPTTHPISHSPPLGGWYTHYHGPTATWVRIRDDRMLLTYDIGSNKCGTHMTGCVDAMFMLVDTHVKPHRTPMRRGVCT